MSLIVKSPKADEVELIAQDVKDPAKEGDYPTSDLSHEDKILAEIAEVKSRDGKVFYCCQPRRPGFGLGVPVAQAGIAHKYCTLKDNIGIPRTAQGSLLCFTFNRLLASFLNLRKKFKVDYMCMLHDDISAPEGWADIMVAEMEKANVEFISAVVPIKDKRGLTSTALETGNMWAPKRLTMKEVFDRPPTFQDPKILLNSGCWVARADANWWGQFSFEIRDQIIEYNGEFLARTISEDWDWTRKMKAFGGSMAATRVVPLFHEHPDFTNTKVWGEWESDHGDRHADHPHPAEVKEKSAGQ